MNQAGTRKPEFRTSNPLGKILDTIAQNISPRVMGGPGVNVQRVGGQLIVQAKNTRGRGAISSGGTLQIVKAQAAGSGGSVSVKNISILSNPASSPNYEETGDAYNVTYFQD